MPELEEPGLGGEVEPVEATPIFSAEKEASIKAIVNTLWDTIENKSSIPMILEHDFVFGKYATSEHYRVEDLQTLVAEVAATKPVIEPHIPTEEELAAISAAEKADRDKVKAKIIQLWDHADMETFASTLEHGYIFGPLGTSEHRLVSYYKTIIDEVAVEKAPKEEPIGEVIK